jgi:hypothetical protein
MVQTCTTSRYTHMSECKTLSVPEAGALYYGLSRNGSYTAAERGLIPTIKVLGKLRVPIILMERRLEEAGGYRREFGDTGTAA